MIKYLSKFLSLKTLDQMYKALVRSHLDCGTIYHIPALNRQPNLGVTRNSLVEKVKEPNTKLPLLLLVHAKVLTGQNFTRKWDGKPYLTVVGASAFFRFTRLKTTSYLRDKLPPNPRPLYRCNNSNTFHEIRCKTSSYKNSCFPDEINLWNNIITNFQNVPTFASRKAHILSLIRPKAKSTFGVHDPLGLRNILQ